MKQFVDEKKLAAMLGQSTRTLQALRLRGGGIPYFKIGRSVRYDVQEVEAYLARKRRICSSDSGEDCTQVDFF